MTACKSERSCGPPERVRSNNLLGGCRPERNMGCDIHSQAAERMSEGDARKRIEEWLQEQAAGYPDYSLCEDGDDAWAFWIAEQDTTSYLHADGRIEWYGTGWPENYEYDGDSGMWSSVEA